MRLKKAVESLKAGQVIAFPTETVFGIGALLSKPAAIKKIYKIKKRPRSKPLQILVSSLKEAKTLGKFDHQAEAFAKKHWPGPYTLIVPALKGKKKLGLRVPKQQTILRLIRAVGPIAATSANISGEKPFLTVKEVANGLTGIAYVLPGNVRLGQASKVIDTTDNFKVLRV
jgi:L-threonylcarbamoyladenylate synthase